jgi:hypothetical protein
MYTMHSGLAGMHFLFYIVPMFKSIVLIACIFFCNCLSLRAQTDEIPYCRQAIKVNRVKEIRNLVKNINSNLLLPLTDSTEENWQEAFGAMELLHYKEAFIDARIRTAMDSISRRSPGFKRALVTLVYTLYQADFLPQIVSLLKQTDDPKLFAMCSEYIFYNNKTDIYKPVLLKRMEEMQQKAGVAAEPVFFTVLKNKLLSGNVKHPPIKDLLSINFLPGEMLVFSFQRSNRNFPGLVMVRGKDGLFIKDENGKYFAVPQLARSNSNMPGYLTNGNTPQGIFKITGYAVSKSIFIGPTTNIQMVLPFEKSEDVPDSITQLLGDNYRYLVPASWKNYYPFFEAYYAGKAGRTEIIAHGTTVNPEYYEKKPYYPLTPTQGCLCTKEIWSAVDGKRLESDQLKLVHAVKKAGGADGYCIVIEIDALQKPVALAELLPYLNPKTK